jgi:micrococcal nuclease
MYDIYDGDTFTVVIDVGNGCGFRTFRIRLFGADCPELKGATKDAGMKAKASALDFMGASGAIGLTLYTKTKAWFNANPIMVKIRFAERKPTEGDKYGRQLAHLYKDGKSLADYLIEKGDALPYSGGTKEQAQWEKTE